jgi:hypothetical protein
MHTVGGPWRGAGVALAACLILASLTAGCTTLDTQKESVPTPGPGNGIVTIWLMPPENAQRYDIVKLVAVPRFVSFHAADNETAERLGNTSGYVGVAKGWSGRTDGYGPDESPKSAERDWLRPGIWFQDEVPAGNYGMIRIEFMDAAVVEGRAQPQLYIGTTNPSAGNPRLSFYAAEDEVFHVEEGKELVLTLQTTLLPEGRTAFLIL